MLAPLIAARGGVLFAFKSRKYVLLIPAPSSLHCLVLETMRKIIFYLALAGRVADPLWPYPCEMANSVDVYSTV